MKTRRSWRNQNRMWVIMGGKFAKTKRKQASKMRIEPDQSIAAKLWREYCTLFDCGQFAKAAPVYAAYLRESVLTP